MSAAAGTPEDRDSPAGASPLRASASEGERRLALVLVGPLPPPSGGMANQTRQLASLLAAEGLDVRLVQTNAPYRPAFVGAVPVARAGFRLVPYLRRLWMNLRGADVVHVMANSGWSWHLFAAPAIWLATLARVPVVVNYRGGEAGAFFARQFRLVRPTLLRAHRIVVPSGFLRDVFARFGVDTVEVPNIVDLAAFRSSARLAHGPPHVLVTRNLEPIYGIDTALRAFARVVQRHPDATMTIAGSGPSRAALERLAAELQLEDRVRFTGRLDNAALPALYRTATVALNPSRADNMPISLLEAMAAGVPIVSTNVGGIRWLVRDEHTALIVPADDAAGMAGALLRIIDDASLAARLAANAASEAPQYEWPRVRPRWLAVYREAVGAAGAAGDLDDRGGIGSPTERS